MSFRLLFGISALMVIRLGTISQAGKPRPRLNDLRAMVHVFPVRGGRVSYSSSHAGYPATDIFCAVGNQFVAPVDGVIQYVSETDAWKPSIDDPATRGGLAVALIGVDGWRHYGSHLSAVEEGIAAGVAVRAGQVLGATGTSGNARGKAPHLHFGISTPSSPQDWRARRGQIDPYPYLRAWERSEKGKSRRKAGLDKTKTGGTRTSCLGSKSVPSQQSISPHPPRERTESG